MKKFNFYLLILILFSNTLLASSVPTYVGGSACKECHKEEYSQWSGSHHDLAMQVVTESSVLGNFSNAKFTKHGVTTRFYKNGERFMVNTDGPDGILQDYEISYTFGVYPLQQYMVKFPEGKVQVLDIAWDTRPKEQGGQRWFSLHPDDDIKAGDVLHWTGPNLNWNYMCADCHSTNLKKNYDPKNKTYQTTFSDINVSCEACHGPGSEHLKIYLVSEKTKVLDNKGLTIDLSNVKNLWQINSDSKKPELKSPVFRDEVELCAKCHSRRSQISDVFVPGDNFRDHYLPALLETNLYYPDGKINDEVYVYGSFKQSLMYQDGVTCSDCHNAHTLKLKVPGSGVCLQCHSHESYASSKHHFHQDNSTGSDCVACHMPAKTYMGIDVRNDHSFRIPRPDIATHLDIPDACTNCHTDKTSQWATDSIKKWYGKSPQGYQQFSQALHGLNHQSKDALQQAYELLLNDTPDIAKATAIGYLGQYASRQTYMTSLQMLRSKDPDIRRQALTALESFPIQHTVQHIFPKLNDPVKTVRLEAARILSSVPRGQLEEDQKSLMNKVTEEYKQSLLFSAERPESQLSLAQLYLNLGKRKMAYDAFKEALRLQPMYVPAYINYSDYYKQTGNEKAALQILEKGLKQVPDSADLHHSLGLWFVRNNEKKKGLDFLQKAAELGLDNARYQYVYAVAVADTDIQKAIGLLEKTLQVYTGNLEVLSALASYHQKSGNTEKVKYYRDLIKQVLTVQVN